MGSEQKEEKEAWEGVDFCPWETRSHWAELSVAT
jgi:hypothetical protein